MNQILEVKPTATNPKTGLDQRETLAGQLSIVLADNTVLLNKTLGCHWNITGPLFTSVHALTEEQYVNIFAAIDDIAERIRGLGHVTPYAADALASSSNLKSSFVGHTGGGMIRELIQDHTMLVAKIREVAQVAKSVDDDVTDDLLTGRLNFHEDAIWKLGALIDE